MRVLFTFINRAGHFYPLVSLAQALTRAGHEVACAADPSFAPEVTACGLRCLPAGTPLEEAQDILKTTLLPPPARRELAERRMFPEVLPSRLLPDLMTLHDTWAPDLVVSDNYEFAGRIAAEAWGIAHASIKVGHIYPHNLRHQLVPALDRLRAQVGLAPDPDADMLFRFLYVVNEPPQLQPDDESLPPTTVRARRAIFDRSGTEQRPAWLAELAPQPTVYATLGTAANQWTTIMDLHADILIALRDEPINLILTVGRDRDPGEFGPQPPNVHVERYIPQSLVLDACDLVVSHAGSGTMLAALDRGLPLVNIPVAFDQPWNALRCMRAGVGLTVSPQERTPQAIRAAVQTVLADPKYRRNAQGLQAGLQEMPGPEFIVTRLEHLAACKQSLQSGQETCLPEHA